MSRPPSVRLLSRKTVSWNDHRVPEIERIPFLRAQLVVNLGRLDLQ